jgi:hypothetical protein
MFQNFIVVAHGSKVLAKSWSKEPGAPNKKKVVFLVDTK